MKKRKGEIDIHSKPVRFTIFLLSLQSRLLGFRPITPSQMTSCLDCMISELILIELYIKGTVNMHMLASTATRDLALSLSGTDVIPLIDFDQTIRKFKKLPLKENDLFGFLYTNVKCSISIPINSKNELFYFLRTILEASPAAILRTLVSEYKQHHRSIPEPKKTLNTENTALGSFIEAIFQLHDDIFFHHNSKFCKTIKCINAFKPSIIPQLKSAFSLKITSGEILPPFKKIRNSSLWVKTTLEVWGFIGLGG